MVEDVIEVDPHLEFCGLAESEELAKTKIHTPSPWPNKGVPLGHLRIIEDISARSRNSESGRVKELVAAHTRIRITNHTRTKTRTTEIADRVNEAAGNVTGEYWIAVIAVPKGCKPSTTLGKHVPAHLETTGNSVRPLVDRLAKLAPLPKRNVVCAIRDEAMTGNKRVARKILNGVELIIERATETRVPDVQTTRLLIQQCV